MKELMYGILFVGSILVCGVVDAEDDVFYYEKASVIRTGACYKGVTDSEPLCKVLINTDRGNKVVTMRGEFKTDQNVYNECDFINGKETCNGWTKTLGERYLMGGLK